MKKKNYSQEIVSSIKMYLAKNNIEYVFDQNLGEFQLEFDIFTSQLPKLKFKICVYDCMYVVYVNVFKNIDVEDKTLVKRIHKFINEKNCITLIENFEFNCDEGTIRFKFSQNCDGSKLSKEVIDYSIDVPRILLLNHINELYECLDMKKSLEEALLESKK